MGEAGWDGRVAGRLAQAATETLGQVQVHTVRPLPCTLCLNYLCMPEPSPHSTPRYVGRGCSHGGAGFPLALYSSPESWHNQSENHEVIV